MIVGICIWKHARSQLEPNIPLKATVKVATDKQGSCLNITLSGALCAPLIPSPHCCHIHACIFHLGALLSARYFHNMTISYSYFLRKSMKTIIMIIIMLDGKTKKLALELANARESHGFTPFPFLSGIGTRWE